MQTTAPTSDGAPSNASSNAPSYATAYRNANIERRREQDRARYERNKEKRKAAALLRSHQKRAEELGVSLEEYREQLAAKKAKSAEKKAKATGKQGRKQTLSSDAAETVDEVSPPPAAHPKQPKRRVKLTKKRLADIVDPYFYLKAQREAAEAEAAPYDIAVTIYAHGCSGSEAAAILAERERKRRLYRAVERLRQAYAVRKAEEARQQRIAQMIYDGATLAFDLWGIAERWPSLTAEDYAWAVVTGQWHEAEDGSRLTQRHIELRASKPCLSAADVAELKALGDPAVLSAAERSPCTYRLSQAA